MITQTGKAFTLFYWCNKLDSLQSFTFTLTDLCWIDIDKRQCYSNLTNIIAFDIPEQAFNELVQIAAQKLVKIDNYLINIDKIIYTIEGNSLVSDSISDAGWVKIPYYEIDFAGAHGRLSISKKTYDIVISLLGLTTNAES